ncbi:Stk1 family PASTA domain-containing Ser/Thr kinase [Aeromicrobium sp. CF4.19]|uniref:Stk1 family PASTA domain-containing Ser/Thr kinase n=1 Tax=Aeromicrobium sp. CF4.19 TaxID=3373082 RepID=UPI003EE51F13
MPATGDDALVGRLLDGRYLIGDRIARGGMASVFKGTDERLDRPVAIKVMHAGLGDDTAFTERFQREARAAAKLNHRGVVSVYDQGHDGDVTYLVMEYVPGRTLRDVMRDEAPMPPRRALNLLADVLLALATAHRENLVHRDMKPENVLITPDGEVKVADFGLARAVSTATTATSGTLMGTVSYLAPEIVVNEGVDRRSDVYACGAMLYEMLTGAKPHAGDTPIHVAYKHVHEDIGAPSQVQPDIPAYVDALVARATARDRARRSTDARVLLQQVRMVQRALDDGLQDDPELVADLLPRTAPGPTDRRDDDEMTERVSLAPAVAAGSAAAPGVEGQGFAGASDPTVGVPPVDGEPTMRWSSSTWQGPEETREPDEPQDPHRPLTPQEYQAATQAGDHGRRGRILLIGVVILAVLLAGFGYWLGVGRYTEAPQLVGRSEAQALAEAEELGFELTVSRRAFSESAPLGTVISTDPAPGSRLLPESAISAVVSKGQERYEVPKTKGLTVDEATQKLEDLNLKLGETTEEYSEDVEEGRIVRPVDRKAGEPVRRGTSIDFVVSRGREPLEVPDQSGSSRADAVAALEEAGFAVQVEGEFDDDVDKGDVISQSPDEGTAFRGDTVTIVVSRGPEEIEVPDVVGDDADEAESTLEEAGFKVRVRNVIPGNEVRAQTPGAGDEAKVGSTITIYV